MRFASQQLKSFGCCCQEALPVRRENRSLCRSNGPQPLPGLSTPVWMTSSSVNPLEVCLSLNFLYRSRVSTLAMWLLWTLRSGNSSSAEYFIFRRLWLFEKGMSDPTAVTGGERGEAYHWGLGRPPNRPRRAARHPGKVTLAVAPPVPFTPLLPHHLPREPGRRKEKLLHLHRPCPVLKRPSRRGRALPAPPGHRPGEGIHPRSRSAAVAAPGGPRRRLWGGGRGGRPGHRGGQGGGLCPAGTPGRAAGERGGSAMPSAGNRASSRRRRAGGGGGHGTRRAPARRRDGARRPPGPRSPGCSPPPPAPDLGAEEREASNKPLYNRRLPRGTWLGRAYVTTLLNTGLIWF